MPTGHDVEDAVAIVPVRNVVASAAFYGNVLSFTPNSVPTGSTFATVRRNGAAIHLLQTGDAAALRATANHIALHIWVHKLDALYDMLKPALDQLPAGQVRPPFDQPYGVREFHVKDPHGCLLHFSQIDGPVA